MWVASQDSCYVSSVSASVWKCVCLCVPVSLWSIFPGNSGTHKLSICVCVCVYNYVCLSLYIVWLRVVQMCGRPAVCLRNCCWVILYFPVTAESTSWLRSSKFWALRRETKFVKWIPTTRNSSFLRSKLIRGPRCVQLATSSPAVMSAQIFVRHDWVCESETARHQMEINIFSQLFFHWHIIYKLRNKV